MYEGNYLSADSSISCIRIVHLNCASYYDAFWEVDKWQHKGILSYDILGVILTWQQ